jgi:sulfate permease, SulP family
MAAARRAADRYGHGSSGGDSAGFARALPAGTLRALPVMVGLLSVHRSDIPADVAAGITPAAVSIPVALGYANIAGMPVVTGLYALLFPMAVFAILGSLRRLVVGADSATAAILGATLGGLAVAGSPQYVRLAGLAALLAGGKQLLAWLARLGFLANFLSLPSWSDSSPASASRWLPGNSPTCWG